MVLCRIRRAFLFRSETYFAFRPVVNRQQMIQRFKDNMKAVIGLALEFFKLLLDNLAY